MDLHPDFKDLLVEFARFEVRYALLGGYAVGYHTKPRATKDMDLLISGMPDNLQRAAAALAAFGAPAAVVSSVRTLAVDEIAYLGAPPVRIDLLRSADGAAQRGRHRRRGSDRARLRRARSTVFPCPSSAWTISSPTSARRAGPRIWQT